MLHLYMCINLNHIHSQVFKQALDALHSFTNQIENRVRPRPSSV